MGERSQKEATEKSKHHQQKQCVFSKNDRQRERARESCHNAPLSCRPQFDVYIHPNTFTYQNWLLAILGPQSNPIISNVCHPRGKKLSQCLPATH